MVNPTCFRSHECTSLQGCFEANIEEMHTEKLCRSEASGCLSFFASITRHHHRHTAAACALERPRQGLLDAWLDVW